MNAEEIFHKAMEIADAAERAAYLGRTCGADGKLKTEVEALLKAHERAGDFLESPAMDAAATLEGAAMIDGPGTRISHYELLNLIGEGGMGLVYLAEQKEPVRRKVALKIIKPGMDSRQVVARFEAERQALALLDHPNIAHVFDAGCTETGRPYFVMEYVKGLPITSYCDHNKVTIEQRLRLFEQVCEAVQHAHQKGIIHRDLKPSNILVSVHGDRAVPKIIDFGIAKAITQPLTDKTFVTFQGQLLGTPEYMSPEQVDLATQDIDTRSDIYSLGVVLYELLAGVLPFESESFARAGLAEIQQTIRELEPTSPSIRLTSLGEKAKTIAASRGTQVVPLARRLHRELEWIPLKAMRKDRCRRYRSASEMADDVRNYLTGLPLLAGPETTIYRVQKFVHKHAGSVATVALVAVAVVLGLAVSTAMYWRSERALQRETAARAEAEQARVHAENARAKESIARTQAEQAEQATKQKAEELRRTLYVNSIQLADAKHREGNAKQVRSLLDSCPQDLRGWEWRRLDYVSDQSVMTLRGHDCIYAAVFSRDGKHVISGGTDGTIKIWDLSTGQAIKTLTGHTDAVDSLAATADGRYIVSASWDKTVRIWDFTTGSEVKTIRGHKDGVETLAVSPDGKLIASGAWHEGTLRVWDALTGSEVMALGDRKGDVECVTFSPDGKRIISGDVLGYLKCWDSTGGKELMSVLAESPVLYRLAVNSDGSQIASAGVADAAIKIWDAETGAKIAVIRGLYQRVESLAFSPDGKLVACGDRANLVKIWDVESGREVLTLRGHEGGVSALAFSPDGRSIMSGSYDGTIKLWDLPTEREWTKLMGHPGVLYSISIAFSPDGKRLVSHSDDGMVKLWDVDTCAELMILRKPDGPPRPACVAFSPDGRLIASSGMRGKIDLWNASTGAQAMTLRATGQRIWDIAFSPDNGRIIVASDSKTRSVGEGTVEIWSVAKGDKVMSLPLRKPMVQSVAFSPDGKRIASGDRDGGIRIWDAADGTQIKAWSGHERAVSGLTFSPDGSRIASGGRDVRVWDAVTGEKLLVLTGHNDIIQAVAFSADATRIISGSRDRTVKVWDATTGAELLSLSDGSYIKSAAFSPDGKTIAAGATMPFTGGIVLWESGVPSSGYEARRAGRAATRLVDELYRKCGVYHGVIDGLVNDRIPGESVRNLAIQIANSRRWEDADKLRKDAQETGSSSDKTVDEYRASFEKAEKANAWEPNDPAILNTLGAAQYRLGSYEDALKTLAQSAKILSDAGEEPDPVNIAFTAMIMYRMGRAEEAKSALEQLRELCKDEQFAEDMEVQELLAEAEGLIEGKKP